MGSVAIPGFGGLGWFWEAVCSDSWFWRRFIEGAEEGGLKYFCICAGPDGMLYCAATAASSVLVIDPRTQTP